MKPFDKAELDACKTWGESMDFFKNLRTEDLKEFVEALSGAKKFVDLTMRDESFLSTAASTLRWRD